MKRYLILFALAAISCQSLKPENPEIIQLGILPESIEVPAVAGEDGVALIADRDYSIDILSGAEWLTLGLAQRDTISFSFTSNEGYRRSAVLRVSADGREDELVVKQEGVFHENAELSEHEIAVPVNGQSISIRLHSNMPSDSFTIDCSHPEIISKLRLSDYILSFEVLPTTNRDKRTYEVTVFCTDGWGEKISDSVKIIQDALY